MRRTFVYNMSTEMTSDAPISISQAMRLSLPIAIIAFLALIVNVAAIVTIRRRSRRHAQLFDILLASLATADAMFSLSLIILLPITIDEEIRGSTGSRILKDVFASLLEFAIFASIVHVVIVAVERLAAVTYPLAHKARVTRKSLFITIVIVWILTFLLEGSISIYKYTLTGSQRESDVLSARIIGIFAYVAGFLLCMVHGRIIWQVNEHRKSMPHFSSSRENHERHIRFQSYMTVVSGAVLSGLFLLCVFPVATIMVFDLKVANVDTVVAFNCLLTGNALLNPIVYFWRGYWTRRRARKLRRAAIQGTMGESCVSTTFGSPIFGRTSVESPTTSDDIVVPTVTSVFRMYSDKWH